MKYARNLETGKKVNRVMTYHQPSRLKEPISADRAFVYLMLCLAALCAVAVGAHQYYRARVPRETPAERRQVIGEAKHQARQWLAGNKGE